jgi:hypothetical protein
MTKWWSCKFVHFCLAHVTTIWHHKWFKIAMRSLRHVKKRWYVQAIYVCLTVCLFLTNSATNVIWKDWTALSGKMLPCDFRQTVAGNVFTKSYWIIHTYIHRYIRSCQRTKRTVAYGGSFICVQFKVDWRLSLTLIWKVYAVCKNKHIGELYTNSRVAAHVHT